MGVELRPLAVEPTEPEEGEQRVPERRRAERDAALERQRDAKRAEGRLEREPQALDGRAHDRDLLRGNPAADEAEHLVGDELQRAARPGPLEEPERRVERAARRGVREQLPLDVGERGRQELVRPRPELGDVPAGQPGKVVDGAPQGRIHGAPRLVRQGDVDVAARGERLEEAPLGSRQVLEAVREDGRAAPRVELAGEPLDRATAQRAAVPGAQPLQLVAVGAQQALERLRELVGVDERAVEVGDRAAERVRVPREAADGRGSALRDAAQDQRALGVAEHAPAGCVRLGEVLEETVEGADGAGEQPAAAVDQLALDALDVRAVRDDEPRIPIERVDEPVEQQPHLPGVDRADDEGESHRSMVVGRSADPRAAPGTKRRSERGIRDGCVPSGAPAGSRAPRARDPAVLSPKSGQRFWLASATGDGRAGHRSCAGIAEVGRLGATPRVGERDAHHRALSFFHFRAALVANQNGLSRHDYLPEPGVASAIPPR